MVQVIKVFVYLLVFVIVLGSGVVAKGTILFMTSQLRQDRKILYCNRQLGERLKYKFCSDEKFYNTLIQRSKINSILITILESLQIVYYKDCMLHK